mmetsp:Transcript_6547/g.12714  ORF Transcript_6547/g.12714 Transcript_6547/m.12714 type:complete len:240 (-) Transcript_6547:43-762(-)
MMSAKKASDDSFAISHCSSSSDVSESPPFPSKAAATVSVTMVSRRLLLAPDGRPLDTSSSITALIISRGADPPSCPATTRFQKLRLSYLAETVALVTATAKSSKAISASLDFAPLMLCSALKRLVERREDESPSACPRASASSLSCGAFLPAAARNCFSSVSTSLESSPESASLHAVLCLPLLFPIAANSGKGVGDPVRVAQICLRFEVDSVKSGWSCEARAVDPECGCFLLQILMLGA